MLNAVHKQLLASKLVDLCVSSPLVLVYQVVGNVQSSEVASSLRKQMDAAAPGHGLQPLCLRIKNTVGALNSQLHLGSYMKANNLLLGWQLPHASIQSSIKASGRTDLLELLALATPPAHTMRSRGERMGRQQGAGKGPHAPSATVGLPHPLLAHALKHSLSLADQLPVALLAAFYQGQKVSGGGCLLVGWRRSQLHDTTACRGEGNCLIILYCLRTG